MSAIFVVFGLFLLLGLAEPYGQITTTHNYEVHRTLICEHVYGDIECPGYTKIKVLHVDYGRWDTTTCPNYENPNANKNVSCRTGAVAHSVVKKTCDGKSSCVIPSWFQFVNNGNDPCGGTWKYVNMTYICEQPMFEIENPTAESESIRGVAFTF